MPVIHLIEGPVGAGKSTYARRLSEQIHAPWFCLDEWIARLFIPDRPSTADVGWYLDRKARCEAQIWRVALEVLQADRDVVLELGLVQRTARHAFYDQATSQDFEVIMYVLDAPIEARRQRVRRRNIDRGETWSVDITDEVFERSSRWWEPPDENEYEQLTIHHIDTEPLS